MAKIGSSPVWKLSFAADLFQHLHLFGMQTLLLDQTVLSSCRFPISIGFGLLGSDVAACGPTIDHGKVLAGNYDQLSDLWSCGVIMYVGKPKVEEKQTHWMNRI